ncbi:Uncharacterised protein [Bordetella pertussis]|nr:Uncharacterised protein [Bordetella pertussis]CFL94127.1 Uncharacterised protein [Bordetella pertussis]CFL95994.1 Uncharacterised protein [Bordetella pertussis]CFM02628.1 Uncharacterised protein [Bordetella pertussis]CFM26118.1 Uncharacterised protein [Bordetella pertussis]
MTPPPCWPRPEPYVVAVCRGPSRPAARFAASGHPCFHANHDFFILVALLRDPADADRHGLVQYLYGAAADRAVRQRDLDRRADRRLLPGAGVRRAAGTQADHPGRPYPGLRGLRRRGYQHDPGAGAGRPPAAVAAAAPDIGHRDGHRVHGDRKLAQRTDRKPPARPCLLGVHGGIRPGHGPGATGPDGLRHARRRPAYPGGHVSGAVPGADRRDGALAPAHAAARAAGPALFRQPCAAVPDRAVRGGQPVRRVLRAGGRLCRQARPVHVAVGHFRGRRGNGRVAVAVADGLAVRPHQPRRPDPLQRGGAGAAAGADVGLDRAAVLGDGGAVVRIRRAAVHPVPAGRRLRQRPRRARTPCRPERHPAYDLRRGRLPGAADRRCHDVAGRSRHVLRVHFRLRRDPGLAGAAGARYRRPPGG